MMHVGVTSRATDNPDQEARELVLEVMRYMCLSKSYTGPGQARDLNGGFLGFLDLDLTTVLSAVGVK